MIHARHYKVLILAIVFGLLLLGLAQVPNKRLILKDGSYQAASKWEIKGDRVIYYSSERGEWEDVPSSMVDWDATNRWEKDREETKDREIHRQAAEEEAENAKLKANTAEVAPGVNLPEQGGVWALDMFQGKSGLEELTQNGSELNKQTKKNILRGVINPLPSSNQTIELKGPKAKVQLHTLSPVIYLNVEDLPPQTGQPVERFRIVHLKNSKTSRVVTNIKVSLTKVKESQDFVPSRLEKSSGDWLKLSATEPLKPGEYAVIEMVSDSEVNSFVWDFGIDPNAPESGTQWKKEK